MHRSASVAWNGWIDDFTGWLDGLLAGGFHFISFSSYVIELWQPDFFYVSIANGCPSYCRRHLTVVGNDLAIDWTLMDLLIS